MLECKSLTKSYGKVLAVNGVSLKVEKQEIFGLIGPNGAGKTTLMKMLTTLLPPSKGDGFMDGISITSNPSKIRTLIGYVPQLISADGSLTGYENLLLFAKLYNIPRKVREKRIHDALETMGLIKVADRYVNEYSGGMIRRLEIVEALLHHPEILYLDEPTSGLDPVARQAVWDHLKKIHKKYGITIFLTTHDMDEADFLCTKVAIMLRGKIVKIGSTDELKASIGENATLNDVFILHAGHEIEEENDYKEVARRRRTEQKRGS